MIILTVDGPPTPWKRPGYNHKNRVVFDTQKKEKEQCRWQLRAQMKEKPFTVPLEMEVIFYMEIPESTSRPRRKQMLRNEIHHMIKPDVDNLQKYILDCMTGVVYEDDCQVVDIRARKIYSETPRTVMCILPKSSCTYKGNPDYAGQPLFEEGEEL